MFPALALGTIGLALVAFFASLFLGKTSGPEARKLVADGAQLIDVRTSAEYADGHLEGAINVPVHQLDSRLEELGDPTRPIVLYCRSGARSNRAKRLLESRGFEEVYDLGAMTRFSA